MQTPLSLSSIVASIKYKDWKLVLRNEAEHLLGAEYAMLPYLQWEWQEEDPINGGTFDCKSRKWKLSMHMTDSEVVQTAFLALKVAVQHETREFFTFQGQPVMRPHFDVYKLKELCEQDAISRR